MNRQSELFADLEEFVRNDLAKASLPWSSKQKRQTLLSRLDLFHQPSASATTPSRGTKKQSSLNQPDELLYDEIGETKKTVKQQGQRNSSPAVPLASHPTVLAADVNGDYEGYDFDDGNSRMKEDDDDESYCSEWSGSFEEIEDQPDAFGTSAPRLPPRPVILNEDNTTVRNKGTECPATSDLASSTDQLNDTPPGELSGIAASDLTDVSMHGELCKKKPGYNSWTKYMRCYLSQKQLICYKKDKMAAPSLVLQLTSCELVLEPKGTLRITTDGKSHVFRPSSQEMAQLWLERLNIAMEGEESGGSFNKSSSLTESARGSGEEGSGDGVVRDPTESQYMNCMPEKQDKKIGGKLKSFLNLKSKPKGKVEQMLEADKNAAAAGYLVVASPLTVSSKPIKRWCVLSDGKFHVYRDMSHSFDEFCLPLYGISLVVDEKKERSFKLMEKETIKGTFETLDSLENGRWLNIMKKEIADAQKSPPGYYEGDGMPYETLPEYLEPCEARKLAGTQIANRSLPEIPTGHDDIPTEMAPVPAQMKDKGSVRVGGRQTMGQQAPDQDNEYENYKENNNRQAKPVVVKGNTGTIIEEDLELLQVTKNPVLEGLKRKSRMTGDSIGTKIDETQRQIESLKCKQRMLRRKQCASQADSLDAEIEEKNLELTQLKLLNAEQRGVSSLDDAQKSKSDSSGNRVSLAAQTTSPVKKSSTSPMKKSSTSPAVIVIEKKITSDKRTSMVKGATKTSVSASSPEKSKPLISSTKQTGSQPSDRDDYVNIVRPEDKPSPSKASTIRTKGATVNTSTKAASTSRSSTVTASPQHVDKHAKGSVINPSEAPRKSVADRMKMFQN